MLISLVLKLPSIVSIDNPSKDNPENTMLKMYPAFTLFTIKNATKILVVRSGSIIESGNHDELINKKGIYYQLYMLQFKDVKEKDLLYLDNKIKMEN